MRGVAGTVPAGPVMDVAAVTPVFLAGGVDAFPGLVFEIKRRVRCGGGSEG